MLPAEDGNAWTDSGSNKRGEEEEPRDDVNNAGFQIHSTSLFGLGLSALSDIHGI